MKILTALWMSMMVATLAAQEMTPDSTSLNTDEADTRRQKESKIYFGGYLNLSFGGYTVIGAEPMIGYKITPKLSTGLKVRYDYIKDNRYATSYTTSNYGGSLFARYRIIPAIYIHAEYAYYNYNLYYSSGESSRTWVPFLFLGAGFSQRVGGTTWLNAQILFDVLQNSNSPYSRWEPFYSIGVGVGF